MTLILTATTKPVPPLGARPAFDQFVQFHLADEREALREEREAVREACFYDVSNADEYRAAKKGFSKWWRRHLAEVRQELWTDWLTVYGYRDLERQLEAS